MTGLIDWIMTQKRAVLSLMAVMLTFGIVTYVQIPKEADPDIPIPLVIVTVPHIGISPEDAERLIVKPLETEMRSIEGLKKLTSLAFEGMGQIILEFDVNFNKEKALDDVREKVDLAKAELPTDSEEPIVTELNASLFPVIIATLSGPVPERALYQSARRAKDALEALPNVLEAQLVGHREELLELIIDPAKLESHGISQTELVNAVSLNNQLVPAGAIQGEKGRFAVKIPGLFESREDLLSLVLKASGDGVVRVGDVADIRRTFKEADGFARFNGEPAIAINVVKRIGANIIETTREVREVMAAEQADWPAGVKLDFTLDQSTWIYSTLSSLEASIMTAILLVMIICLATLGVRSALLVGFAIPCSFFFGFLFLGLQGLTVNMMVMFGMVIAVGMLVDGAIIITEYADRRMSEGLTPEQAYADASKRMFWPVVSSTATTLAAFLPLLFWPGITGKFMAYLPLTVIYVLVGSIIMAMIFLPVLGSLFGRPKSGNEETMRVLAAAEHGDCTKIPGITGFYARTIDRLLHHRFKVLGGALAFSVAVIFVYAAFNNGTEFFTEENPEQGVVIVRARGNLSAEEMLALVLKVEKEVRATQGVRTVFTQVGANQSAGVGEGDLPEDAVGRMSIELVNWRNRPNGRIVLDDIRQRTAQMPGVIVEVRARDGGPPTGKAIQMEVRGNDPAALLAAAGTIRRHLDGMAGLIDIEDSRPLPGIEWQLSVDREQAGRFGADIVSIGAMVQLVTNGVKVGEYRPDDSADEIDIRLRYPPEDRGLQALDRLRVQTNLGLVPISNFVTRTPAPLVNKIERIDSQRVIAINASTAQGVRATEKIAEIKAWLATAGLDKRVTVKFRGADEESGEVMKFLPMAFLASLFLMGIILLVQFNSFYHTLLILSAVVFSTIGVLLGVLIMGQTFSLILTGTGIVALAGIVVNNNIVLIDTYQHLRREGLSQHEAIVRTGAQRLRPVFLTTATTILGLLPMVFQVNMNFFTRDIVFGDPQSFWWVQLATAVSFGLAFSTLLTLVLTPILLSMPSASEIVAAARDMAAGWLVRVRAMRPLSSLWTKPAGETEVTGPVLPDRRAAE